MADTLFNEISDWLAHGFGGKTSARYPEMSWWVQRAKQNGELKRLPGETKSQWEKRIRQSWGRFCKKYDLNRSTGSPKHRSGNLGRVDGPGGMPDWLRKREKQIKGKPLRGRHPNKRPLGKPRGERHAKSTKTGTGRGAGKA